MLNKLVVVNSDHARDLSSSFKNDYNRFRPHQGIGGKRPNGQHEKSILRVNPDQLETKKSLALSGLMTHFALAA